MPAVLAVRGPAGRTISLTADFLIIIISFLKKASRIYRNILAAIRRDVAIAVRGRKITPAT